MENNSTTPTAHEGYKGYEVRMYHNYHDHEKDRIQVREVSGEGAWKRSGEMYSCYDGNTKESYDLIVEDSPLAALQRFLDSISKERIEIDRRLTALRADEECIRDMIEKCENGNAQGNA